MARKSALSILNLNLLKPQGEGQKIFVKAIGWALSFGRYIVIFVEVIVLLAFLSRFKLDADIQSAKEEIDSKTPFIDSLKSDEILIRQTQLQLLTIKNIKSETPDYAAILRKISDQVPNGVVLESLNIEKSAASLDIRIIGNAQNNNELTTFIFGLKGDTSFSEVNITTAGLEQNLIHFAANASVKILGVKL